MEISPHTWLGNQQQMGDAESCSKDVSICAWHECHEGMVYGGIHISSQQYTEEVEESGLRFLIRLEALSLISIWQNPCNL